MNACAKRENGERSNKKKVIAKNDINFERCTNARARAYAQRSLLFLASFPNQYVHKVRVNARIENKVLVNQ